MAESEEELKSLSKKVKEESEKADLKLNIQKTKIMASCPITSWHIDGATMKTVRGLIFLGSKVTADGDCSHEIKKHLLLTLPFSASRGCLHSSIFGFFLYLQSHQYYTSPSFFLHGHISL